MICRRILYAIAFSSMLALAACGSSHKSNYDDDDDEISSSRSDDDDADDDEYGNASAQPKAIYTSKPDENKMASDLVGRKINEGVTEGYHDKDWTHTIEYGQISGLSVVNVVADEPDLYVVETNMRITPSGTNYYYDTNLKLTYVNTPSDGWILDSVTSLGMNIVTNGAYDDSISARIGEDGWGGTMCVFIRNNSDTPLIVGGRVLASEGWKKFSTLVQAHEEAGVGGLFNGGSVDDYVVDFVVRQH